MSQTFDIVVIGGGINGVGIARDAAGRGLRTLLCEKDDLGQGTSSRSGKLIHGGLRYLEYFQFRLVREALIEREVLLNSAPHIIWPMRFVLPHSPDDRPAWVLRLGLAIYDNLGGRKALPGSRPVNLLHDPQGAPIKEEFPKGFEYSDCWVDDARLVSLCALDAREKGAHILTRTACTRARRKNGHWAVELTDQVTNTVRKVQARVLVNAAGPWVNDIIGRVTGSNSSRGVRLIKGSHIIVKKFWDGPQAYLIQNSDKRVIFINPYQDGKALIGTTDIPYNGRPEDVQADKNEIDYLLAAVNRYFIHQLQRRDVLATFSGVRPLYDDNAKSPSAVSRDYIFDLDDTGGIPMLSIFGGKITTYRKLAEHAIARLAGIFPAMGPAWTMDACLPGGDIPDADFDHFRSEMRRRYDWLPDNLAGHYSRLYGTRIHSVLAGSQSTADLGRKFGPSFYEAEARYLVDEEWAGTAEDILDRRTKHGLQMTDAKRAEFTQWFGSAITKQSELSNTC